MKNTPLVTVIIPSYNHQQYVEQTIFSVINQTYKNIELIVIDDGSKDDSVEIIAKLARQYDFRFISKKNEGLTKTLNQALDLARGDYFAPFGSDDIMLLDRIEKQVRFMEMNPDFAISGGNMVRIEQDGTPRKKQKFYPERELCFDEIFENRVKGAPAPTLMYRIEQLKAIGGYDESINLEDFYTMLMVTSKGEKVGIMRDILALYRSHPTNTYKNYPFMVDNILKIFDLFSDRPNYQKTRSRFLNGMINRVSKKNKKYAIELLKQVPLKYYNRKTVNGILKIVFC